MPNTHQVGDRTEAIVMAKLLQVYDCVLIPFGNGRRYDLVVDSGEQFLRIQCKTGRLRSGAVVFNTHSQNPKGRTGRGVGYRDQVELFGVYCPDTDKVYLVPVADVTDSHGYLRVDLPKNGQKSGVRMAAQYELQPDNLPA
jgi:hypothetical protein